MGKKKRQRNDVVNVAFDLTPMIDVTFQLIIFFILTMKIRQKERREVADLPQDEGPAPMEAPAQDFLVLRTLWRNSEMRYEVNFKFGNNEGKGPDAIVGGNLATLMNDRKDKDHKEYHRIFNELLAALSKKHLKVPSAKKIELAMSLDSTKSSSEQIGDTAPWGFVTLAIDVCTAYNKQRMDAGLEGMSVTFKNTEPGGAPRIPGQ